MTTQKEGLTEEQKLELEKVYGPSAKSVTEPCGAYLEFLLAHGDIWGTLYLVDTLGGLCFWAMARVRAIQEARGEHGETLQ